MIRESLTEKVTLKYRLKGGDKVGQVEGYNGLSLGSDWLDSEGREQTA